MAEPLLMTVLELASAVGGTLVGASASKNPGFTSVCIDSRSVTEGSLFVALIGTARDGHDYVESACAAGAGVVLVAASRMESDGGALRSIAEKAGATLVVVPNTLKALQDAASAYLDRFPALLKIGITGSSGKTTTKELAASMIGMERRVVMNLGNLNSETGLPLSAFTVRAEHEVGIFEMGMNRRGEIGELAAVLRPRIALVTNVGTAHIGILGSRDAIAEEKKAIFSKFTGTELALVGEGDEYADFLVSGIRGAVRRYGPSTLQAFGGARSLGLDGTEILWGGLPARLALPGAHNLANALAAAAISEAADVSAASIRKGIEAARPLFGRGEVLRGAVTVVRDCYNANPEATEAAIAFCDSVDWGGRRVYIVGSMLELGELSTAEHRRIGAALAASRADAVVLFGKETEDAFRALSDSEGGRTKQAFRTDDIDELSRMVASLVTSGDLVLLKGSRGTALERLTDVLIPAGTSRDVGEGA